MLKTSSKLAQLTFRPVIPDDQAFLLRLYASTRLGELRFLDWNNDQKQAFIEMQFKAQRQHYETSYPRADARLILLAGQPVGRVLIDRGERETTLIDISLLTEYCGLGIGTGLIQELLAEGRPVRLHVLKSNPALRLYQRLGFSVVGDDAVYLEMVWFPEVTK